MLIIISQNNRCHRFFFNKIDFKNMKCLFVATVATDSAVFVATLPVEKKYKFCETGSVATNTALSVAALPVECQSLKVNHLSFT